MRPTVMSIHRKHITFSLVEYGLCMYGLPPSFPILTTAMRLKVWRCLASALNRCDISTVSIVCGATTCACYKEAACQQDETLCGMCNHKMTMWSRVTSTVRRNLFWNVTMIVASANEIDTQTLFSSSWRLCSLTLLNMHREVVIWTLATDLLAYDTNG